MAKITRTYYTRRRAGAYRRFYRRYTRRISRKMYNRVSLNYMRAKIDFQFSLEVNDNNNFRYWFHEYGGANREDYNIDVMSGLNDLEEYKLYMQMFNEVKLIGVAVTCVPYNQALQRNSNPVLFYATYKNSNNLTTPLILNPQTNTSKYFKNWDRKWVPSNQDQATQNQGRDLDFYINTASQSTVNKANSPGWSIRVTAYMQFRKNLTV